MAQNRQEKKRDELEQASKGCFNYVQQQKKPPKNEECMQIYYGRTFGLYQDMRIGGKVESCYNPGMFRSAKSHLEGKSAEQAERDCLDGIYERFENCLKNQ